LFGETQTPLQTVAAVQALRNARLVEEFAHAPYQPLNFVKLADCLSQFATVPGATTTALIEPDKLYVFSPAHQGVLDLRGA
jgi:hypothetical protein